MPFTLPLTYSVSFDGARTEAGYDAVGSSKPALDETIPGASSDLAVTWSCDVSELDAIVVLASTDMTVETNSAGSPVNTLALKAGRPVFWFTGCGWACPLTADVTALYVTKAGAGDASLRIWALQDATP